MFSYLGEGRTLLDPRNPPRHQGGGCYPLWTGTPTSAQLTLSRHYWVVIEHGGVLDVHESTSPLGYVSILGETGEPTLGWKEGSGAIPE
jgi:hypothetical protein